MDKGVTKRLYGNYRAKVVENKDRDKFGRVVVWIPDLMPLLPDNQGIWARPANNPIGGRNTQYNPDNHYMGSCYIPRKGAWVWVFFEAGNINRPYYFAGLDVEQAKVLPENQVGSNYQDKWTIFKSSDGRAIVISDDPDDERVEITGKKREMNNPPSGDTDSVYRIDDNQTTILLDERDEKQKLLIKSYKGDFIKLDIENRTLEIQVASDVHIKSGGHLFVTTSGEQHFLAQQSVYITSGKDINILAGGSINSEAGDENNIKSGSHSLEQIGGKKVVNCAEEMFQKSGKDMNIQSGGKIARDASPDIFDNSGASKPPPSLSVDAPPAVSADPDGERKE
jgi:hypothetical protein